MANPSLTQAVGPRPRLDQHLFLAFVDASLYQSLSGSFEDNRRLWVLFGMMAAVKEGLPEAGPGGP